MKLGIQYDDFCKIISGSHLCGPSNFIIENVAFDTRKIVPSDCLAFFALKGEFRDGNDFVNDAYRKGVRIFVVSQMPNKPHKNAAYILVEDSF